MSDEAPPLPENCAACVYFVVGFRLNLCRRHAPSPGHEPFEVTQWPVVRSVDRCGSGADVTSAEVIPPDKRPRVVRCHSCAHWLQPVIPDYRQGRPREWWDAAGLCTLWAPAPSVEEDRRAYWRVTHAEDGCGDGAAVP